MMADGRRLEPAIEDRSAAKLVEAIQQKDKFLHEKYRDLLTVNRHLDRRLVSFQANKEEANHRWCKYKEGFSASLVRYILHKTGLQSGRLLDPFAGSGTTLFTASEVGLDSFGIEILPCSAEIIEVRKLLLRCDNAAMARKLRKFADSHCWEPEGHRVTFPHLAITSGAFPEKTEWQLCRYLWECEQIKDVSFRRVCRFAALCVLESISYTRKDGQYLRWDSRSGRQAGKPFDKGVIVPFTRAITDKLNQIASDLESPPTLFATEREGEIELVKGSCLDVLPTLPPSSFDCLITSPPYCNRYDYTRTYALELALMGIGEKGIRELRQSLLSCTVENRAKTELLKKIKNPCFDASQDAFHSQDLLQTIVTYLDLCRQNGTINNTGIPRMVRGYFEELAFTIFECGRILKPGAKFFMVNDNVKYLGIHIPVDLILSDFAGKAGFEIEAIWVLPRGKGNSSQQMGTHGREEVRKCVYVWNRVTTGRQAKRQTLPSARPS